MSAPPTTGKAKVKGKAAGKVRTIDFEEGETIVAGEPTVRQLAIGQIVWANGHGKRQIWGLINTAGDLAQGGSAWHEKALAEMNAVAARGVQLVVGLQEREDRFRADLLKVKTAVKESAKGLAEVKKLGPAIAKRMKQDDDFYGDIKDFTTALATAKKSAKEVSKAAKDFDAATNALKAAVFDEKTYQAKKDVEAGEAAVRNKQAQIDEAKAIFRKVIDIAGKVVKQEWGAIATMALDYAQEKALDAAADALAAGRLIEQLEDLKANLAKARAKVDEFEKGSLDAKLQEMQDRLESAAKALEMAHDALHEAVADLPGAQRNAINELNEDKSTAPAAQMISARITQLADIEKARASCGEYAKVADKANARMQQFVELFRQVGTFLAKAAKDKPYYAEDKPYGRELYRASLKNSIAFGDWSMSIPGVKREAENALKWLASTGADGPLANFDQAIESTRKDLGRP
ncbi:MAG TPA: hypothetical protein VHM00_16710 [Caldimonas sp.]|nr:hypothetical protein [Caldimonas sp.]